MREQTHKRGGKPEARAEARAKPGGFAGADTAAHAGDGVDILHLAELVAVVRERLALERTFPDDAILASLKRIAGKSSERARYEAAFTSNLGQHLGKGDGDLDGALSALVGLLPPPRS